MAFNMQYQPKTPMLAAQVFESLGNNIKGVGENIGKIFAERRAEVDSMREDLKNYEAMGKLSPEDLAAFEDTNLKGKREIVGKYRAQDFAEKRQMMQEAARLGLTEQRLGVKSKRAELERFNAEKGLLESQRDALTRIQQNPDMDAMALYPFLGKQGQEYLDKNRELSVPGFKGWAPGIEEAKTFRAAAARAKTGVGMIDRLMEIYDTNNKAWRKGEAASLATQLRGISKTDIVGPGAVTEAEWQMLKDVIPDPETIRLSDPTTWSNALNKNKTRLETIRNTILTRAQNEAESLGLQDAGYFKQFKKASKTSSALEREKVPESVKEILQDPEMEEEFTGSESFSSSPPAAGGRPFMGSAGAGAAPSGIRNYLQLSDLPIQQDIFGQQTSMGGRVPGRIPVPPVNEQESEILRLLRNFSFNAN